MAEALDPILSDAVDALAHEVLGRAHDLGVKLATAESCTGGLLASLLTDVPNLSHSFERGFVTYSNEAKSQCLGVPPVLLEGAGAVSEACARAMAEGALAASGAQLALSITGWAEAGPDPERPAGLVYFGCASDGAATTVRKAQFGDIGRARLRLACLEVALRMMSDALTRMAPAPARAPS